MSEHCPEELQHAINAYVQYCRLNFEPTIYRTIQRAQDSGEGKCSAVGFLPPAVVAELEDAGYEVTEQEITKAGDDARTICYTIRWGS